MIFTWVACWAGVMGTGGRVVVVVVAVDSVVKVEGRERVGWVG